MVSQPRRQDCELTPGAINTQILLSYSFKLEVKFSFDPMKNVRYIDCHVML
jgi:hypothetical protein